MLLVALVIEIVLKSVRGRDLRLNHSDLRLFTLIRVREHGCRLRAHICGVRVDEGQSRPRCTYFRGRLDLVALFDVVDHALFGGGVRVAPD